MRTAALSTLVLLAGCATAPPPRPANAIDVWAGNHPEAARELGEWVRAHPQAASLFFRWDGEHPIKSHDFVTWTITHPGQNLDAFVIAHPGWPYFDQIMERHRPAAEAFMFWARRHPAAAEALMNHPRGLEWAGRHLYQGYWRMEAG